MRSAPIIAVTISALLTILTGCSAGDPTGPGGGPATAATSGGTATATAPAGGTTTAPGPAGGTSTTPSGSTSTTPSGSAPSGTTGQRVTLDRSGGIAGRGDTVTVEPDGRWTVVDRAGAQRTGRLSPADLDRLRQLTTDPRLATEARRTPTADGCADAFVYRLSVAATVATYSDCPSDADRPPVTAALVELLTRATG